MRKSFSFLTLFSTLLWIDATSALAFRAEPPPPYVAYQLKSRAGFFPVPGVHVASPRDARYFDFKKVESILMPAAAPGEEDAPALPLLSYKLKEGKQCSDDGAFCASKRGCSNEAVCAKRPRYAPETLEVTDANAAFVALTIKPDHVLVPADVATDGQASRPDAGALSMDAYTCYRAKAAGLPRRSTIELADSFEVTSRLFELKRFSHLCLPSSIRGSTVHRGKSALSCYVAKPAKGEAIHERIEALSVFADYQGFEAATRKERRVCLPATIGPEVTPWTVDIQVDGELSDWPSAAAFPTDQGTNSIGWDDENIYVSVSHPALAGAADGISVVVYLGDGKNGLLQTPVIGSYAAHLPRPMSLALRFEPAGAGLVVETSGRGGWSNSRTQGASAAWDSSDGGVELSIPRSLLSEAPNLYAHVSLFDDRPASERNFGGTPRGSEAATELGENRFVSQVIGFTLADDVPPISNGKNFGFETAPPWVPFPQPAPASNSLRIATFNVGHLEIPVTDAGLIAYIEGVVLANCALFTGPFNTYCAGLANLVVWPILYDRDDEFEEAFGWESNEVRARAIAKQLLGADLDVLVLNEVFDESAAEQYVKWLKGKFPYRIERIQPSFAPNPLDFYEGMSDGHFGAYRAQNSGLMLFSRYPLRSLQGPGAFVPNDTEYVVADPGGTQTLSGGPNGKLAFRTFGNCRKSDCMAGKGVGLVQIEKADRPATIVFTHMQASYSADSPHDASRSYSIRRSQIEDVMRDLIKVVDAPDPNQEPEIYALGDMNVIGRHLDGPPPEVKDANPTALNAHYDTGRQEWLHHFCGDGTGGVGEPFSCDNNGSRDSAFDVVLIGETGFNCGGGTADSCDILNLVDSWAYDSSPADLGPTFPAPRMAVDTFDPAYCIKGYDGWAEDGDVPKDDKLKSPRCYGERLDFLLHNKPGDEGEETSLCAQHMTLAHKWSTFGTRYTSDHLPVRGDFNRWWEHCRPVEAAEVTISNESASPDYLPPGQPIIMWPGSMQWYKITEAGAYSLAVDGPTAVDFDVYREDDLSRPISSYHGMESEWGTRYSLPDPPYFVRVFAVDAQGKPDRAATGEYGITIHRHMCTSAEDACTVVAGGHHDALWPDFRFTSWDPADPNSCLNQPAPCSEPDALWFLITSYRDDADLVPEIRFRTTNECLLGVQDGEGMKIEVLEHLNGQPGAILERPTDTRSDCPNQPPLDDCNIEGFEQSTSGCGDDESPNYNIDSAGNFLMTCGMETQDTRLDEAVRRDQSHTGTQFFARVLRPAPWVGTQTPFAKQCKPCSGTLLCSNEQNPGGAPKETREMRFSFGTDMTFWFPRQLRLVDKEDGWPEGHDEIQVRVRADAVPAPNSYDCKGTDYRFFGTVEDEGTKLWPGASNYRKAWGYLTTLAVEFAEDAEPNDYCEKYPEYIHAAGDKEHPSDCHSLFDHRGALCTLDQWTRPTVHKMGYKDPGDSDHYHYELVHCVAHEMPNSATCSESDLDGCFTVCASMGPKGES
ncbi:MAG: hypothetical protein P8R42_06665 [Candidatus Binatia bacterium]|nr:hypothetical protein [Candidatus Binatia bacterium]